MTEKLGPQFQRVYHSSFDETPVHLQRPSARQEWTPDSNMHPDVIHTGSLKSTLDIEGNRPYIHAYDIDMSHPMVSPVVWGEEAQIIDEDDYLAESRKSGWLDHLLSSDLTTLNGKSLLQKQVGYMDQFNERMRGRQPGLWEETPADVVTSAETGTVMPYRNRREDIGSVSFVIPKNIVDRGPVRYAGVRTREQAVNDEIDRKVKKK